MSETKNRIIYPSYDEHGRAYYDSVFKPASDKSIAICYMLPERCIPVIFVPGIMGTNLMNSQKTPIWLVDSGWSMRDWLLSGPKKRKILLDPKTTFVYNKGKLPEGTTLSDAEKSARGWGEVSAMSYGPFLPWLETHLNDCEPSTNYGRKGLRAELMKEPVSASVHLPLLDHDEVAISYRYRFPVHAVGYNWLQSNRDAANRLHQQIEKIKKRYRDENRRCEKVIIVTHSMGGLVARYYSEVLGTADDEYKDDHGNTVRGENKKSNAQNVLGILHGVMPANGAATAYKRVKSGTEGVAGPILGNSAAMMTPVFAQSPGPLQLLPNINYDPDWLKISDENGTVSLPKRDPYVEIYLQRDKWWGLINDRFLNPFNSKRESLEQDWEAYENIVNTKVIKFHKILGEKYHKNTYVFYGADPNMKTWGDIKWKRMDRFPTPPNAITVKDNLLEYDTGTGLQILSADYDHSIPSRRMELQGPDESGDGTVPLRSGRAPEGMPGVKVCVPFKGFAHEGAYKDDPEPGLTHWTPQAERWRFTLWAITKIAYEIRHVPNMAYRG